MTACNYRREVLPIKQALNWQYNDTVQTGDWSQAIVPGSIYKSLLDDMFLDRDYLYSDHYLEKIKWISDKTWLYKATFFYKDKLLGKEELDLVLEGADTYAQIYVNDQYVGQTNDYYRKYVFDISKFVRKGENQILIKFKSPYKEAQKFYKQLDYQVPQGYLSVIRKPYFHLVDSFSVNYNPIGLWGQAYLLAWEKLSIQDVQFYTKKLTDKQAELKAKIKIKSTGNYKALLEIESQYGTHFKKHLKTLPGLNEYELTFKIDSPKLWYPRGFGEQHLYRLSVKVSINKTLYDEKQVPYGLRTVKADTTDNRFSLYVNGQEIKLKAIELRPLSVEPREEKNYYKQLLDLLENANVNTIITWDKGFYHKEEFYDLCDQKGFLVIQSFMLPVKIIPPKDTIVKILMPELKETISGLRHHPSIIAWTSNYEYKKVENRLKNYDETVKSDLLQFSNLLFKGLIPKLVKDFDDRPYIENLNFRNIWTDSANYVSVPRAKNIVTALRTTAIFNDKKLTGKFVKPKPSLLGQISEIARQYGVDSLENLEYFSQLKQAEIFERQMQKAIINPQYDNYIIPWFNDITPYVISPSAISNTSQPKAKYYSIKHLFSPFVIFTDHQNQYVNITLYSDYDTATILTYYKLYDLKGELLWQKINKEKLQNHKLLQTFDMGVYFKLFSRDTLLFKVEAYHDLNLVAETYHYFKRIQKLNLEKPELQINLYAIDIGYALEITPANFMAKNVLIESESENLNVLDNFFDVLPGENKIVILQSDFKIQNLENLIRVYSYYDMLKNISYYGLDKTKKVIRQKEKDQNAFNFD